MRRVSSLLTYLPENSFHPEVLKNIVIVKLQVVVKNTIVFCISKFCIDGQRYYISHTNSQLAKTSQNSRNRPRKDFICY